MNQIVKSPISTLGYNFIPEAFLPKGKDEYYLRNTQNRNGIRYRHLSAYEIEVLVRNRNTSDNWNNLQVSDSFLPELVQNCKFFGLVRIGKLPVSFQVGYRCYADAPANGPDWGLRFSVTFVLPEPGSRR